MAGRPRSFDRDAALALAMEKFWRDGYEATTIAELTSAMGITPPSLYAAFGDKDQLFAAASTLYFDAISARFDQSLALPTLREAVEEILFLTAGGPDEPSAPPGCFLATEPRLATRRAALRERLAHRVEQARREGEVPPDTDPAQVADYVMAVHSGLSSRARDGASSAELRSIAMLAMNGLH